MRRVTLQGTDICVSRLSYGTASLHHLPTSRRRQYLLEAVVDHGFTHFDTAPYYGFGIAEQELGRFLRGRRGSVTLTTKVGLYPPGGSNRNTAATWICKLAGKVLPAFSRPVIDWSIAVAARSLENSRRQLGVDQIDLLLLHEPVESGVQSELFLAWLEKQQEEGRIRAWGLAGDVNNTRPWLSSNHPLGMVLQVRDSLDRREADVITNHGRDLQITYGYLSSVSSSPGSPKATKTIRMALQRNVTGSIIVSTRKLSHLDEVTAVVESSNGSIA